MNSTKPENAHSDQPSTKAKAMAIKYQKYYKKKSTEQEGKFSRAISIVNNWIAKCIDMLTYIWGILIPVVIRGPSTPYETFLYSLSQDMRRQLQHIQFCKIPLTQAVQQSRITLLITYTDPTLPQTLQILNNNQQINSLINKKSLILPLRMNQPQTLSLSQRHISVKIKELIDSTGLGVEENQVFVVWKGLYQEIVVIGRFQLTDPELSVNVSRVVEAREDYQEIIKKIAYTAINPIDADSTNNLFEQTAIPKSQTN